MGDSVGKVGKAMVRGEGYLSKLTEGSGLLLIEERLFHRASRNIPGSGC